MGDAGVLETRGRHCTEERRHAIERRVQLCHAHRLWVNISGQGFAFRREGSSDRQYAGAAAEIQNACGRRRFRMEVKSKKAAAVVP